MHAFDKKDAGEDDHQTRRTMPHFNGLMEDGAGKSRGKADRGGKDLKKTQQVVGGKKIKWKQKGLWDRYSDLARKNGNGGLVRAIGWGVKKRRRGWGGGRKRCRDI